MHESLEKWSLDKHYKSIHVLSETSSKSESLTPRKIVEIMVETILQQRDITIIKNPNFKVLDPSCGTGSFLIAWYEVLIKYHSHEHIINNMLYGFDTDFKRFRACINYYEFKNVYKESFLETNKLDNMIFDVTIGNPPYDGKGDPLHLQFLNKCIDLTKSEGYISFLQPSTFLIDQKKENPHYQKIRNKIGNQLIKVQLFPKNVFDNAANNTSISATYIQKNVNNINDIDVEYVALQKNVKFKSIEEINQFADRDVFISIKNKVLNWCNTNKNLHSDFVNKNADPSKFSISIPAFQRFKFFGDNAIIQKNIVGNCIQYQSEDMANAVLDYLKDDFAKFCLHIFKPNMHLHSGRPLRIVPSFNSPSDFKKAKKLIGITDDEYDFIKKVSNNNKDYFFFS